MIADYLVIVIGISVFDILGGKQEPASHELAPLAHFSSHDKTLPIRKVG
jgi:hypothetical protein